MLRHLERTQVLWTLWFVFQACNKRDHKTTEQLCMTSCCSYVIVMESLGNRGISESPLPPLLPNGPLVCHLLRIESGHQLRLVRCLTYRGLLHCTGARTAGHGAPLCVCRVVRRRRAAHARSM